MCVEKQEERGGGLLLDANKYAGNVGVDCVEYKYIRGNPYKYGV